MAVLAKETYRISNCALMDRQMKQFRYAFACKNLRNWQRNNKLDRASLKLFKVNWKQMSYITMPITGNAAIRLKWR